MIFIPAQSEPPARLVCHVSGRLLGQGSSAQSCVMSGNKFNRTVMPSQVSNEQLIE